MPTDKVQIDKTRVASEQSRNESLIREGSVFQVGTPDRITKFLAVGVSISANFQFRGAPSRD